MTTPPKKPEIFLKNPMLLPEAGEPKTNHCCPACKSTDFNGRNNQGTVLFTCAACKQVWGGGHYQAAPPPNQAPMNPNDLPLVSSRKDKHGQLIEERRSPSLTQNFRKGAPIPSPGDEDV